MRSESGTSAAASAFPAAERGPRVVIADPPSDPCRDLDLVIVGGGIGGLICLKYARDAGLKAVLLEAREAVGGLWRDLPAWQDIQIRKEDWTLGDLPLAGERQPDILRNIEAWVERFDLTPGIRLSSAVRKAEWHGDRWWVTTEHEKYESRWLIAATGGHNRPRIPDVARADPTMRECHSSQLQDPEKLRGRRVTVVGGGASAFDLLDLCFRHGAASVNWVYRTVRWMRPTRQAKYFGTDMRELSRLQMLGAPSAFINSRIDRELRGRYARAGIEELLPDSRFDIRRNQLVPGRREMIANFDRISRFRGEVASLEGTDVELTSGERFETDLLLWATGYDVDFSYLEVPELREQASLNEIARRCGSVVRSLDAPNLFVLAPGILETNTSTTWAYAHVARSMMAHIQGRPVFDGSPRETLTNHYDLVKMLAPVDRSTYGRGWRLRYLRLAFRHPFDLPLPIP